ncbi:MAG: 30S ribosomal protein S9 [Bacteroidales bacterium]|jgi:small subunit ribosomal protein S9|nr:30S ribosomal protein S9 [Bacteroidales bacterium]
MEVINAIGRRKAAVARVYLSEGNGEITINNKDLKTYFPVGTLQYIVEQPASVLELTGKYNVKANLDGGGIKGQAEALRLAISRAFVKLDETNKPKLKAAGFMTRNPHEVERKKPGRPKARKRFQFSKR